MYQNAMQWPVAGEVIHAVDALPFDMGGRSCDAITVCALGDSITEQHHTGIAGASVFREAYGYMNVVNALMSERFKWHLALNLGGFGANSSQCVSNLSLVTAARTNHGANVVIFAFGTNDAGATVRVDPQTVKNNMNSCIAHARSLGMQSWILPILPRSFWGSLSSEDITQRKADILDINRHFATLDNNADVFFFDTMYAAFTDGNNEPLAGYTHDGLHPLPLGAFVMGREMVRRLSRYYTSAQWPAFATNLITNSYLTGSSGTLNTGTSGLAPTGWELSKTSAGTGSVVGSRNADGSWRLASTLSGGSASDTLVLKIRDLTGVTGSVTKIQAFVDCHVVAASNVLSGPIKLVEKNSGGSQLQAHLALDKRNSEETPLASMGRCVFASEPVVVQATTQKVDLEIRFAINAATSASITADIYRAGVLLL